MGNAGRPLATPLAMWDGPLDAAAAAVCCMAPREWTDEEQLFLLFLFLCLSQPNVVKYIRV
jgi:hypothetical protein